MNVSELIEVLKNAPPHAKIIQSTDPEGNEFRTLEDISIDVRVEKDAQGSCELVLFPEDADEYDENEILEDAVVLWP